MPGLKIKNPGQSKKEPNPTIAPINEGEQKPINVNVLKGRVCYFSLTGDLALKAFEEIKFSTHKSQKRKQKLKEAVLARLYFAVIMFDRVVLHCSDPLRSELVLEILEEHKQWIESGRIAFIFSNDITNVRRDYRNYIQQKIEEYSDGYCTEKEANSLRQGFMTDAYYERVIRLLETTPVLIRKPRGKANSFDNLVLRDLDQNVHHERVILDSQSDISQILTLDLSLHQLLNVRLLSLTNHSSKCEMEFAFPLHIVNEVSTQIRQHLKQGNVIARSAIVDSVTGVDPNSMFRQQQQNILKAITLRMDVLYCRMNSGKQLILEFHPSYESRSIYQTECFSAYLSCIADCDTDICLDPNIINAILSNDSLNLFRLFYLACMADTKECMSLAQPNSSDPTQYHEDMVKLFKDIVKERRLTFAPTQFDAIKQLLRGEA